MDKATELTLSILTGLVEAQISRAEESFTLARSHNPPVREEYCVACHVVQESLTMLDAFSVKMMDLLEVGEPDLWTRVVLGIKLINYHEGRKAKLLDIGKQVLDTCSWSAEDTELPKATAARSNSPLN